MRTRLYPRALGKLLMDVSRGIAPIEAVPWCRLPNLCLEPIPLFHGNDMLRPPVCEVRRIIHEPHFVQTGAEFVATPPNQSRHFIDVLFKDHRNDVKQRRVRTLPEKLRKAAQIIQEDLKTSALPVLGKQLRRHRIEGNSDAVDARFS